MGNKELNEMIDWCRKKISNYELFTQQERRWGRWLNT